MDQEIITRLSVLINDYAVTHKNPEHFHLDNLESYPGELPFPIVHGDTPAVPAETEPESLHISPSLVEEIKEYLQHTTRKHQQSFDPLEQLALQLDELTLPKSDVSPHISTADEKTFTIDTSDEAHSTEDDQPMTFGESVPPTIPKRAPRSRRSALITLGIAVFLVILGTLYLPSLLKKQIPPQAAQESPKQGLTSGSQHDYQRPLPRGDSLIDETTTPSLTQATSNNPQSIPAPSKQLTSYNKQKPSHFSDNIATSTTSSILDKSQSAGIPVPTPQSLHSSSGDEEIETVVIPPTLGKPKSDGTFTIQVCSTPSYTEALRWKLYLEQRSNWPVSIVEYTLRDQLYYRVRIGTFSTQGDARRAAMQIGLNSAAVWIVQIH